MHPTLRRAAVSLPAPSGGLLGSRLLAEGSQLPPSPKMEAERFPFPRYQPPRKQLLR